MKLRLFLILVLVAAGIVAVVFALRPATATGQQGQLLTAVATRRTITADAVATGNVAFDRTYALTFGSGPSIASTATSSSSSSSSSGGGSSGSWIVSKISVTLGEAVKKGQVLATATAADLSAQLSAAKNQLKAQKNQLTDANEQLDNAPTTDAERAAHSAIYQAEAQITSQEQTISQLERQLSYATLKAPAAGIVTAINAAAGFTAPSGAAVELGATPLEVVGSYAESDLGSLAVGQPATVSVAAANASVNGTVVAIAPTAGTTSGSSSVVTYDVTIALNDAPEAVKPGMSADVSITTASAQNVIAVPSVALSGGANGYTVQVMASDGSVTRQAVEVGLVTSAWAEIRSGIAEGTRVVTGTATARQASTTTTGGFGAFPGAGGGRGNFGGNGGTRGGNGGQVTQP